MQVKIDDIEWDICTTGKNNFRELQNYRYFMIPRAKNGEFISNSIRNEICREFSISLQLQLINDIDNLFVHFVCFDDDEIFNTFALLSQ
jgi:hypothetical protein